MKEGLRKEELRKDITELMDGADTYRLLLVRAYLRALLGLPDDPVAEQN